MKSFNKTFHIGIWTVFILLISCSSPTDNDSQQTISLGGKVVDTNNKPIENAIVRIISPLPEKIKTTDSTGVYDFSLTVDSTTTYTIDARKEGYQKATEEVLAVPERDIDMPAFTLEGSNSSNDGEDPVNSGNSEGSEFISLETITNETIQVKETGGTETTELTFEVTDAAGVPVDIENAVYVNFEIAEGPGGGEKIYPDSVLTNNGMAKATLESGTSSGVIQIRAYFTREEKGKSVQLEDQKRITKNELSKTKESTKEVRSNEHLSFDNNNGNTSSNNGLSSKHKATASKSKTTVEKTKLISVSIQGGFPHKDHFEISAEKVNQVSALKQPNQITIQVADKYGNPPAPNSKVSFKIPPGDNGFINGEPSLDESGKTTAQLEPGSPGFTTVSVETVDEYSQTISKDLQVLFSGKTKLCVEPASFDLEKLTHKGKKFTYCLRDENGNPLAEGTSVSVSVDHPDLSVSGNTDVILEDTQESGPGTTDFSFTLKNPSQETITEAVDLVVEVQSPNGNTSEVIKLQPQEDTSQPEESANAGNITLSSVSTEEIGVVGTGQTEQAKLTFQITDSTGQPLAKTNAVEVNFRLGDNPGGGADVQPKSTTTDENGQATTTLTSGENAGVAQVIAEIKGANISALTSKPIPVAIAAGLPVQGGFNMQSSDGTKNAVAESGTKIPLTVYAADKHGNAVPEGTLIAFSTDNGMVTSSAKTNAEGEATATYTASGSSGMATITASTADSDEQPVTDELILMLSGSADINSDITSLDLTDFQSQTIGYTLSDLDGNPLVAGTNVSVSLEHPSLTLEGDTDVTLGEHSKSGDGVTEFAFTLSNTTGTQIYEDGTITLTSDGPNGSYTEEITLTAPEVPVIKPGKVTLTSDLKNVVASNMGQKIPVTAYVRDENGNVMPEGTEVTFTANGGYIKETGLTDTDGKATSNFTIAEPIPQDGKVDVTAKVEAEEATQTLVLSGIPVLSIEAPTVDLGNFASVNFSYTIADANGNPLAEGTNIDVSVDHPALTVTGDVDITLGDVINAGPGTTDFEFTLENPGRDPIAQDVTITVSTDGPNGNISEEVTLDAPAVTPASIVLATDPESPIGVIGTGQKEQTDITFRVLDQNGQPIDPANAVDVSFNFGGAPGGDEELFPESAQTNNSGEVTTTLTSGTQSGVTQVIAEVILEDGTVIRSQPLSVAIHSGLPDEEHFTVLKKTDNVPARSGQEVGITAYVGDKYGNIVPKGTTIYFTTDGGYITGSSKTDEGGIAIATLTAVNPTPNDGNVTIMASTANDQDETITTSTDIIFSGTPIISGLPQTFDIANESQQTFDYNISDVNGNAMPIGTTIDVSIEGDGFNVVGDDGETTINSGGRTDFSFTISDDDPDNQTDDAVYITVTVTVPSGPQSSEQIIIETSQGTKHKTR